MKTILTRNRIGPSPDAIFSFAALVRAVRPSSLTVLNVPLDAVALAKTTLAVKEVAGMIVYRVRGDL